MAAGWYEPALDLFPSPLAIVELGTGRVVYANRAADELAGGTFPKAPSADGLSTFYGLYHPDGRPMADDEAPGVRAARGERFTNVRLDWDTPHGRRTLTVAGGTVHVPGTSPVAVVTFEDITEELGHAQQFATRIKQLYGVVPGSLDFSAEQSYLQPPEHQTDIVHVIKGVIEAETGAIEHYNRIIEFCDDVDLVTQDMVIAILRDEEGHRRLFEGYLREYEAEGLA